MRSLNNEVSRSIPQSCKTAIKMAGVLSLCLLQISCGGAGGAGAAGSLASTGVSPAAGTASGPVARLLPSDGSTKIVTAAAINASFDRDMDTSTINAASFRISGPDGAVSGTVSYDGVRTASFTPAAPLLPLTSYTATLSAAIKDPTGQQLASRTWSFSTDQDTLARPATDVIPSTLFGLHIFKADSTTPWPTVKFGSWRLWNANVNWPNLEPKKGEWHFDVLDRDLALAQQNNVEVILPLAYSPTWASARPTEAPAWSPGAAAEPANLEDWKNYVRTVATRYKGRIAYYELWNEPNLSTFFSGSVDSMITLAQAAYLIIKEVDPAAQVITPSASSLLMSGGDTGLTWLESYLAKGGANYADIIGYHFYQVTGSPETQAKLYQPVRSIIAAHNASAKPLWNTESGWLIQNHLTNVTCQFAGEPVLSDDQASGYVARAYVLAWASAINRYYWFGLDSIAMALMESDGKTMKAPAVAYNATYSWLKDAAMISCGQNSKGVWVAQLTRSGGYRAAIVWSADGSASFELPKEWNAVALRDLAGNRTQLTTGTITVGSIPVLVENR